MPLQMPAARLNAHKDDRSMCTITAHRDSARLVEKQEAVLGSVLNATETEPTPGVNLGSFLPLPSSQLMFVELPV